MSEMADGKAENPNSAGLIPEKDALIEVLVARNLDELSRWKRPAVSEGAGPYHPEIFDEFEASLLAVTQEIRKRLSRVDLEALRSEYDVPFESFRNPLTRTNGVDYRVAKALKALKERRPPWFAGGLNVEDQRADMAYWGTFASFSLIEATLLSIGIDPRGVHYDSLFERYGFDPRADEILYDLEDRYTQIARGLNLDEEHPGQVDAELFLSWVREREVPVHPLLLEARSQDITSTSAPDSQSGAEPEKIHGHSHKSYCRTIIAMAINKYGLTRQNEILATVKAIVHDSDLLGFNLANKTVCAALRRGWEQLSADAIQSLKEEDLTQTKKNTPRSMR